MKVRKTDEGRFLFYCEGCGHCHVLNDTWNFNNDFEKPTFSPSVLNRKPKFMTKDPETGETIVIENYICHSFVRNGEIEYLNDCSHHLAGQTIPLKDEEMW